MEYLEMVEKIKQTEFDIAFKKYIEKEFGDELIW